MTEIIPVDGNGNELATMNGFQGSAADVGALVHHAGVAGAVSREEAEIKAAIVLARSNPRNEMRAFERLMNACKRPTFADNATYAYPRGGQTISGPSVYLAREMARVWGNIRSGFRVVSMDREYVHVKGYCHDIETNSYKEVEAKFRAMVQRKDRQTRETRWVTPDERDLRELINKHGALCERNAILQTMPSDFIDDALAAATNTLNQAAANELKSNPADAVKRMVLSFSDMGVSAEMLVGYLGHPLDAISPDELAKLRQVFASIKDGNSRREDHFDASGPKDAAPGQSKADALAAKHAKKDAPNHAPIPSDPAAAAHETQPPDAGAGNVADDIEMPDTLLPPAKGVRKK